MRSVPSARGSFRPIAIGILLPIAALLLTLLLLNGGDEPGDSRFEDGPRGPEQVAEALGPATGTGIAATPATASTPPLGGSTDDPAEESAGPQFTVAIAPLDYDRGEPRGSIAFPSFLEQLLGELQSIPGIEIVELAAPTEDLTPDDADFYLETRGSSNPGPPQAWTLQVRWEATREDASGGWSTTLPSTASESIEAAAREAAEKLRRYPFPPADRRAAELEGIALDSERLATERFEALMELHDIPKRFELVGRDERRMVAVAGAAIVRNATDPEFRGRTWQAMVGVEDPYLVGPLVDSLLLDSSEFVRVEATKLLAREYSEDPRAQSTLQYALVNDLSAQVRAHARWEGLDDEGRRGYLVATLGNPDRSDAERFQLIAADVRDVREYFDRQAIMSLIDIAGRARPSAEQAVAGDDSGAVSAAQVVPLLIEYLKVRDNPYQVRASVASALNRHVDEPGVREALEELSRNFLPPVRRREVAPALRRSEGPAPR